MQNQQLSEPSWNYRYQKKKNWNQSQFDVQWNWDVKSMNFTSTDKTTNVINLGINILPLFTGHKPHVSEGITLFENIYINAFWPSLLEHVTFHSNPKNLPDLLKVALPWMVFYYKMSFFQQIYVANYPFQGLP